MKHRPECLSADVEGRRSEAPIYGLLCICDRLETCEKRGYSAALDAAREAVASMVIKTVGNSAATVEQALAAIDAFREQA